MEETMRKNKVVPLRIPEHLDELAALRAQEEHTDKATALRQWLHHGAADYVLKLVADGRVSVGRAAELLDVTVYDIHHLAERHGVELGATDEQRERSHALAARLGRQDD
jgi:hypothetical protein